jgi:hypothetical protein
MTLATAIYTHLTTDAGVAALVGTRVYPVTGPQQDEDSAVPSMLVYALSDRRHEYSMGAKQMVYDTWTFVCVAGNYDTAHSINDALIASLDHRRITLGGTGGVDVQTMQIVSSQDVPDEFELGIFQVRTDYEFVY